MTRYASKIAHAPLHCISLLSCAGILNMQLLTSMRLPTHTELAAGDAVDHVSCRKIQASHGAVLRKGT